MSKIFISHATEDNELSRKLAKQLRLDGAEVWIYYSEFEAGELLPKAFKEAIEWCDTLMLLWSKASAHAEIVKMEYRRALVLKKTIILCLLDDTEQTHGLRKSLNIDFENFDEGYIELAQVLNLKMDRDEEEDENIDRNENRTETDLPAIQFRGEPGKLSEDEVTAMIKKYNFFDIKRNETGTGFDRKMQFQEVNGDKIIFDPLSDLMWQYAGTSNSMWYDEAKNWITELNQRGYAGYNDWRFPTLEEAMSLMKKERADSGLNIDPMFDPRQIGIWTSDLNNNASRAWVIFFNYGSCYVNCFDFNNFVRAVRTKNKAP
jgi:hypothetical protein